MITIPSFFTFFRAPLKQKLFVVSSISAIYWLILYEVLPTYLVLPNVVFYLVFPLLAISFSFLYLPRMLNLTTIASQSHTDSEIYVQPSADIQLEQMLQSSPDLNDMLQSTTMQSTDHLQINTDLQSMNDLSSRIEQLLSSDNKKSVSDNIPVIGISADKINETAIDEIVNKKISPVENELSQIKDNTTLLKDDVTTIKTSIDEMFSKFETAMIDLKSLQSELSNPLNALQTAETQKTDKQFESILSIPVRDNHSQLSNDFGSNASKIYDEIKKDTLSHPDNLLTEKQLLDSMNTDDQTMKLGQLMNTIAYVGEIVEKLGNEAIPLLSDHCKLVGINPKTQDIIMNAANMISKSDVSIKDTLIMIYKFGQLNGLNDKESDEYYVRLMTQINPNSDVKFSKDSTK